MLLVAGRCLAVVPSHDAYGHILIHGQVAERGNVEELPSPGALGGHGIHALDIIGDLYPGQEGVSQQTFG